MNLKATLDDLAKELVDEASKKDASFADKLDTFKELRAYYAMQLKNPAKSDEDEDGGFNFGNGVEHGIGGSDRIQRRRSS